MKRVAFTMKLKKGFEEEYKRRHDEIWSELSALLTESGITDYSIFLDEESGVLFAYHTLTENNNISQLPSNTIMKKWWNYMADIMDVNSDNSPIQKPLREVFHID